MNYILSLLPQSIGNKRTIDYIYLLLRTAINIFSVLGILVFVGGAILAISRIELPLHVFFSLIILLYIFSYLSLSFGYWNGILTTRQKFHLFTERELLKQGDRLRIIKRYIFQSYVTAALICLDIIILTLNNFLIIFSSQLWEEANSFIKYNGGFFNYHTLSPLIGSPVWNTILLILPVVIFSYLIYNSYNVEIVPNFEIASSLFKRRFFRNRQVEHLFNISNSKKLGEASLNLGADDELGTDVVLMPDSRRLHTSVIGPIGSGKSVAIALRAIIQDTENIAVYLKEYARFIKRQNVKIERKKFTSLAEKEEYRNELYNQWFSKGLGKHYINGMYVNEPTGDLIKGAIEIVEKTGFPEEMIWLVDPTREDTEGINLFDAETNLAAGLTADLIKNFAESGGDSGGNTFFKNAEIAYVRNLVIMLKNVARIEGCYLYKNLNGGSPTLSEFYDMLENVQIVVRCLKIFRVYRDALKRKYEEEYERPYQELYEREKEAFIKRGGIDHRFDVQIKKIPELKEAYQRNRDAKSRYRIVDNTYQYFARAFVEDDKTGMGYFTHDANIEGMKNTIRKLANSELVRRIFFSQSTKNLDVFLKMGGFLFVNTARGPVDDDTSRMIGQITDLMFQKAVFRRSPKTMDPFFSAIKDEAGWVVTANTERFLNQSRKYNVADLDLYQNYEQVEADLGAPRTAALFNSYRNLFVFQGSSKRSVESIIERAGTVKKVSRQVSRGRADLLAGNVNNSESYREQVKEEDVVSYSDLFRLEELQLAGIPIIDNEEGELVKISPTPSYKMPIFNDELPYKKPFNMDKEKDKESYHIWAEQVERYYREWVREDRIPLSVFTEEEKKIILGESEGRAIHDEKNTSIRKPITKVNSKKKEDRLSADEANLLAKDMLENGEVKVEKEVSDESIENTSKKDRLEEIATVSSDDNYTIRQGTNSARFNPLMEE